jgi:vacuolar-type H+-ATPase subunit B/Vma2
MEKSEKKELYGTVVQAVGPVIDVRFEDKHLPALLTALKVIFPDGKKTLVSEVMQHIGDDTVRSVAMGATEGVERGIKVLDTEAPITVPVGDKTLGRMFNVLGEPIDGLGDADFKDCERDPIHREAPSFAEQKVSTEDPRNRHQGHRFALPLCERRQNRSLWRRRRRQNRFDSGTHFQHRFRAPWHFRLRWGRRTLAGRQ